MEVQSDFEELLSLFNEFRVEYVIVGGYALAFHGAPRFTGDLDILIRPVLPNAARVVAALERFGFGSAGLKAEDFVRAERVVQLGVPPVRVDIMTSLSGVATDEAFASKVEGTYGNVKVFFIGRAQFVANKRSVGRKGDMADLEALGEG